MTRRRRTTILGVLALWAIALVLIAFGLFPQGFLRGYVELQIQNAVGPNGRASIRRMHIVPGKLAADVEDLVVEGPSFKLVVPRARLRLGPGFLWGHALSLEMLEASSPTLLIRPAPGTSGKPLEDALLIGDLRVSNATVIYQTVESGTLVFKGVSLNGSVGTGALRFASAGGEWQRDPALALGPLRGQIQIKPRLELHLDSFFGRIAHSEILEARGPLGRAAALNPDVQFGARLDLADAQAFEGLPVMKGLVQATGRLSGPTDRLNIKGDLSGEDLVVSGWPVEKLTTDFDHAPERTTADITARLLGGEATAKVRTDGETFDGSARLAGVSLQALRAQGVSLGDGLTGRVSGTVNGKGPLGGSTQVDARLELTGAQGDMPIQARLSARGAVGPKARSVDLRYSLDLLARAAARGGAWEQAQVVAQGTAKGALPKPTLAGTYEGTVRARAAEGVQSFPVGGRYRIHGDDASGTLTSRLYGGRLEASVDARGTHVRRLDVAVHTVDLARVQAGARGTAEVRLQASGPLDRLSGSGTASLDEVFWNGTRVGDVEATLQGNAGRARVSLVAPEMQASGDGTLTRDLFRGTFTLAGTPLAPLAATGEDGAPLTGQAWGTVDVTLPLARPQAIKVDGRFDRLEVAQGSLSAASTGPFTGSYANRRLTVRDLEAAGPGFTVSATGSFGLDPRSKIEGRARFTADLTRFTPPEGWSAAGTAEGDVALSGTRMAPRADGLVRLRGVELKDARGRAFVVDDGQVRLAGDAVYADGLRGTVPGGFVDVSGRFPLAALLDDAQARKAGLTGGEAFAGRVHFDFDLAKLPAPARFELAGRAQGDVAISGTRTRPRATGDLMLRGAQVSDARGRTLRIEDGLVRLVGDAIETDRLRGTVPGGFVELSGRFPLAALLDDARAQALGLPAENSFAARVHLDVDLAQLPSESALNLTGRAQGDLDVSGTRERPRATGQLHLTGVTLQSGTTPVVGVADGRVELIGDAFTTPGLRVAVGGGFVDIAGRVPLAALLQGPQALRYGFTNETADVTLTWQDVQAATVIEALRPGREARVDAILSGNARFTGLVSDWRQATGELHLVTTGVRVQDQQLVLEPVDMRLADGRLTTAGIVISAGEGAAFRADGSADLRSRTLEATGRGRLDLSALSPFLEDASLSGFADVDVQVAGPLTAPRPTGTLKVAGATLRMRDIRQPMTDIAALVILRPGEAQLVDATALLGGGTLRLEGGATLQGLMPSDIRVTAKGEDIGIRYPVGRSGRAAQIFEELKARVNVDLTLTGQPGDLLLTGAVAAERSLYDADIFLEEGLLAPDIPPADAEPSRVLRSIALNLSVFTENPFLVRNNLAKLEAEGSILLRGDMQTPAPFGRFEVRSGGKVFLQEREFTIESGHLIYTGSLDPDIAIRATTLVPQSDGDIEATVVADGPLMSPRLTLSSDPPLSEREVASLIATGRTNVALDSGAWIVGEQAGGLLAGRFTRRIARELQDLGLDQVDIQPELLAREGQPSARFTFGKQLTPQLRIIYSTALSNSEARYYQALFSFRPGREVSLKAQRQENGGYTYGIGQRLRFGSAPPRRASSEIDKVKLREVRLDGALREFPDVLAQAKAETGDKVTYFDLLDDADRIREHLIEQGYLEAVVDARLEGDVATFAGVSGPQHRWVVQGLTAPPDLDPIMKSAEFEEEAVQRARERILAELRNRGHLRGTVETRNAHQGAVHTLTFEVEPGPVLTADMQFPGATALSASQIIRASGGPAEILASPREAEERIRAAYRGEQYLLTKVGPAVVSELGGVVRIVVPIEEGPLAVVANAEFVGATADPSELLTVAALPLGGSYDPLEVSAAVQRIRDRYLKLGYAAVRVEPRVTTVGSDVVVRFVIQEGKASVVGPIEIVGLRKTRESVVRNLVDVKAGEPLDPRKLAALERRLQELGIFRRAVVTASEDTPAVIRVELQEEARYQAAYDFRYNTAEGFSALIDGEVDNVFGRGLSLGTRFRAGRTLRETRGSFHLPSIGRLGDLTGAVYQLRETIKTVREVPEGAPVTDPFEAARREEGWNLQQTTRRFSPVLLLYGYRYKRTTCPIQGLPPITRSRTRRFDPCDATYLNPLGIPAPPGGGTRSLDVAAIDVSAVRETRDDPLNAMRGSFLSVNLQFAPKGVGGDFDYVREFVQGVFLRQVNRSLTWAQAYRLGAIHMFGGQRLPFDDLFRAGGPTSVRGFATDSLGPRTTAKESLGGEAVVVVNQELRYQHERTGFGAVAFYDTGDVFDRLRDVDFKLRHTVGAGLRYDSPLGLLRVDLAVPIGKRNNDRSYQVHFGLGHAF